MKLQVSYKMFKNTKTAIVLGILFLGLCLSFHLVFFNNTNETTAGKEIISNTKKVFEQKYQNDIKLLTATMKIIIAEKTEQQNFLVKNKVKVKEIIKPYFPQEQKKLGYRVIIDVFKHMLTDMKKETGYDLALVMNKDVKYVNPDEWKHIRTTQKLKNNWDDSPSILFLTGTINDESMTNYSKPWRSVNKEGMEIDPIKNGSKVYTRCLLPIYNEDTTQSVGGFFIFRAK